MKKDRKSAGEIAKEEVKRWKNRCERFLSLYEARKGNYLIGQELIDSGIIDSFAVQKTCFIIINRMKYFEYSIRFFSGFEEYSDTKILSTEFSKCICFRNYFDALNCFNFLNKEMNYEKTANLKILSLKEFYDEYTLIDSIRGEKRYEKRRKIFIF